MKPFLFIGSNVNTSSETKSLCLFAISLFGFELWLTLTMKFYDIWQGIKWEAAWPSPVLLSSWPQFGISDVHNRMLRFQKLVCTYNLKSVHETTAIYRISFLNWLISFQCMSSNEFRKFKDQRDVNIFLEAIDSCCHMSSFNLHMWCKILHAWWHMQHVWKRSLLQFIVTLEKNGVILLKYRFTISTF